ncbi:MAG: GYD domain-containing protein [Thermoplasmata archaeon]
MPYYVVLANWTEQGVRSVKESPGRAEAFRKAVAKEGGKVLTFLFTMGPHDIVATLELPSDEAANRLALQTARLGNVRTTTLKGWDESEFARLAASV